MKIIKLPSRKIKQVVILRGTKLAKNLQSFKGQSTYPERSSNIRQQNCNRVVTNNSLKIWVYRLSLKRTRKKNVNKIKRE